MYCILHSVTLAKPNCQLSPSVPHLSLCHWLDNREEEDLLPNWWNRTCHVPSALYKQSDVAHGAITSLNRGWGVTCEVVQVTDNVSTTKAFTHQSSMGVAHCSSCTVGKSRRGVSSPTATEFVFAVLNVPHFQVKSSWLIHVWRNLTRIWTRSCFWFHFEGG